MWAVKHMQGCVFADTVHLRPKNRQRGAREAGEEVRYLYAI